MALVFIKGKNPLLACGLLTHWGVLLGDSSPLVLLDVIGWLLQCTYYKKGVSFSVLPSKYKFAIRKKRQTYMLQKMCVYNFLNDQLINWYISKTNYTIKKGLSLSDYILYWRVKIVLRSSRMPFFFPVSSITILLGSSFCAGLLCRKLHSSYIVTSDYCIVGSNQYGWSQVSTRTL